MRADLDMHSRAIAQWIGQDFPQWFIMWGAYSRAYWAYPAFPAPRGTIVHSHDPGELTRQMREIQMSRDIREPYSGTTIFGRISPVGKEDEVGSDE